MGNIKWKKLNRISEVIVGRRVTLNLSTSPGMEGYNALVGFSMGRVDLFLNGNTCKSDDMVINAVSHELAHVTIGNEQHGEDHTAEWSRIEKVIQNEYKKG